LSRPDSKGEPQRAPEQQAGEPPPGQFVSAEHESDCSRFLEEVKNVVRRRLEAGLSPNRY
jgi:hypothetical protein